MLGRVRRESWLPPDREANSFSDPVVVYAFLGLQVSLEAFSHETDCRELGDGQGTAQR